MPFLTIPLALFALASVPALVSIYWLRNRFRSQTVSSLLLWQDVMPAREGGLRMQKLQTPLTFFLELLALALLALAATDPRVEVEEARRPLAIVLDDSYSMTAGGEESPRQRAIDAATKQLAAEGDAPVTLIAAGLSPQVLLEKGTAAEARARLEAWRCVAPGADLQRAIALASDMSYGRARVLVLTDHPPTNELGDGRVRWRSLGRPTSNVAFVNAVRSAEDDRVLLEVQNASDESVTASLTINGQAQSLRLAPRERRRLWVQAAAGRPLTAELGADAVAVDNRVVLLPEERDPVRVRLALGEGLLDEALRSALEATGRVQLVADREDLVITTQAEGRPADAESWVVRFVGDAGESTAYVGPFVTDRAHALTQGVSLAGVIWSASPPDAGQPATGRPVVMAGNTPLVTELEHPFEQREVVVRLRPELSTLISTPSFPAMVWNLVDWRARAMPGLERSNVRLGAEVRLSTPRDTAAVTLSAPSGEERTLAATDREVHVGIDSPGVYTLRAGERVWPVSVNTLSPAESDVTTAQDGEFGGWIDDVALSREYRSVAWVLLLVALALILWHGYLVHRAGRAGA